MRHKFTRPCAIASRWPAQPEAAAFVCSHVFGATRPVLLVSRADGNWQCLCGGYHAASELPRMVAMDELLQRDSSLGQVLDLPEDWEAGRASVHDPWIRTRGIADA